MIKSRRGLVQRDGLGKIESFACGLGVLFDGNGDGDGAAAFVVVACVGLIVVIYSLEMVDCASAKCKPSVRVLFI
jgi:hypothetical protein